MKEIAQPDDEHPTEEPNRPISHGQRQNGERSTHNESDNDNVEEELFGPPRSAR